MVTHGMLQLVSELIINVLRLFREGMGMDSGEGVAPAEEAVPGRCLQPPGPHLSLGPSEELALIGFAWWCYGYVEIRA